MKGKDVRLAKTIKASRDIDVLGLKKEDILCSSSEEKNNKVFVFKDENFSDYDGATTSTQRIVTISESVVANNPELFTLVESFKEQAKPDNEFSDISTEDLMVLFINLSTEIQRRIDATIPK